MQKTIFWGFLFPYIANSYCRHDRGQDSCATEPAGSVPVSGAAQLRCETRNGLPGAGHLRRTQYGRQSGCLRSDGLGRMVR